MEDIFARSKFAIVANPPSPHTAHACDTHRTFPEPSLAFGMSSSTSGGEDAADDDVVFSDAKEELDQSETEVGASLFRHTIELFCSDAQPGSAIW